MHIPTIMPWFANFQNNKVGFFGPTFALVVAGNLPYFRRNAIENGDFNTFTFDGCYLFGAPSENFSNRPIASSMEGMLIVINSFQTHIVQIYIDIQGCVYHFRTCYGGSWRNWVKIN